MYRRKHDSSYRYNGVGKTLECKGYTENTWHYSKNIGVQAINGRDKRMHGRYIRKQRDMLEYRGMYKPKENAWEYTEFTREYTGEHVDTWQNKVTHKKNMEIHERVE